MQVIGGRTYSRKLQRCWHLIPSQECPAQVQCTCYDPKNDHNPWSDFIQTIVAHIVAAALEEFDMDTVSDNPSTAAR